MPNIACVSGLYFLEFLEFCFSLTFIYKHNSHILKYTEKYICNNININYSRDKIFKGKKTKTSSKTECKYLTETTLSLCWIIDLIGFFMWELGGVIVSNATFNNISVISWRSVLLVEELGENHQPAASHWQTLLHNVVSSTPRLHRLRTHNANSDRHWHCIGSCKSKYHAITTTMSPLSFWVRTSKTQAVLV